MSRLRLILAAILCLVLSPLASAQSYTSIVVFGDSLSDTGNFAHLAQSKYLLRVPGPIADYTDGRFTDGTDTTPAAVNYTGIWLDQLAAALPGKPAVLNSLDGGTNYAYGFASTGTGTSVYMYTATSTVTSPIPLSITVDNIGQQVTDYLTAHPAGVPAKTLVVVWGGANDLLGISPSSTPAQAQAIITASVTGEVTAVQRLVAAGATNILVPNLPPLGAIPRLNANAALAQAATAAAVAFNTGLKSSLASLQAASASSGITLNLLQLDIYTLFTNAIAAPTAAGFVNVTASSQTVTAVNPDTYLFWDDLHPTTAGHHAIAVAATALVAPAVATTTVLTSSALNVTAGTSVTFTANVTATAGSPTGTVTFYDGTTAIGTGTLTANGTTTSAATLATSTLAVGTHTITAAFAGSTGFTASTSSALTETVAALPIATTTTLTSSALTANTGTAITFTAKVAAATGTPAGTVTFLDGSTSIGTGTLAAGSATFTTSTLTAGTHTITASYSATTGFLGSTSAALTETVVAASFTAALSPTTLTLTSGSAGSSTLTVTPAGGYAGTIAFSCGTLPSMASCVLSPASLTFTAASSAAQTTAVKISTNSKTPATAFVLFPLGGLGMLLALRRRRTNLRLTSPGLFLLLVLLSGAGLLGFTGCGGGSTVAAASTSTPAGTYPVTITVTPSTGAASTLTLSLVVQ